MSTSPNFDQVRSVLNHLWIRHVAKTGEIKSFVVLEESGIAKGVRRVIAVTGDEARQASQLANDLEAKFKAIVQLDVKEREKAVKVFETVSQVHHVL